jgi:transcriptional regulator PpsR
LAASLPGNARGRVIVFGRDMRPAAVLQQRVVNAQQAMERDYWRLRDAETRYRLLFQIGTDAMLIVDGATYRITEANAAANELFGDSVATLVGASFPIGFDRAGMQAAQVLLGTARAGRAASDLRVSLAHGEGEVLLAAAMFRQENTPMFVVRVTRNLAGEASAGAAAMNQLQLRLAQSLPDCLVLTDQEGSVLWANPAFAQLAQLATADQARGEPLGRWLGRTGVDQSVLVTNLRQRSAVRLFSTTLRGELGSVAEVEISATVVNHGSQSALGFSIRDVERRIPSETRSSRELPQSVGHLTELVGRVPIKEIVGETTDVIEQLCIEAALDLTRDNRAAAAELLGLSRQSLYVKMRRFGLGDLAAEAEA